MKMTDEIRKVSHVPYRVPADVRCTDCLSAIEPAGVIQHLMPNGAAYEVRYNSDCSYCGSQAWLELWKKGSAFTSKGIEKL